MRTANRLATAAVAASLAIAGFATSASAAIIEGKIMWLGAGEPTVTINKKTYRVAGSTKVIVSGKPGSFQSLKPGMACKANIANGAQATSLICTGKGRDPLPNNQLPVAEPTTRPAGQAAGQSAGQASGQGSGQAR